MILRYISPQSTTTAKKIFCFSDIFSSFFPKQVVLRFCRMRPFISIIPHYCKQCTVHCGVCTSTFYILERVQCKLRSVRCAQCMYDLRLLKTARNTAMWFYKYTKTIFFPKGMCIEKLEAPLASPFQEFYSIFNYSIPFIT